MPELPLLLEQPYRDAYQRWKSDNSPPTTAAMLKTIEPVIEKQLYRFSTDDRNVLRPHAKLITLQAMDNYDPTKASLNTYLSTQLQRLNRVQMKQRNVVHAPEKKQYDAQRIQFATNELTEELGRSPTITEVSERTYLSPKRIESVMKMRADINSGRYDSEGGEDDAFRAPAVSSPLDLEIKLELIYPDLSDQQKLILEHTLGLYGKRKLSNNDIARKLNVSPAFISQQKNRIQRMMDKSDSLLR
jgi:DNA-directed RNA polymerase specialized sigma subunit